MTSGNRPSPEAGETIQVRHSSFLADSDSFSLLTPPGFPIRIDLVSGNSSTLDLCLGNGPLFLITIITSPYMGSDHLPVIIGFPSVPPPPPTSHRPQVLVTGIPQLLPSHFLPFLFLSSSLVVSEVCSGPLGLTAWRKNPFSPLHQRFYYLEAQCKRVILDEKHSAWASFRASLSFSTSVS
ncbi:hypothetical protein E2C01_015395 [Portunus trituberculatus]|uniref:Endonuclease/exonuclease/phosphatase domain-containing protein n=1 Tax=Portunus trituberculatus TaxID=210409 RepID=A0A5B7DLD9_PORTR|nr:hypothetical protein [Portunus trituberculatus]